MPTRGTFKLIAAGFLASVLVWSLIPDASRDLKSADWAELPENFSSEDAIAILDAQTEGGDWMRATGTATSEDEILNEAPAN